MARILIQKVIITEFLEIMEDLHQREPLLFMSYIVFSSLISGLSNQDLEGIYTAPTYRTVGALLHNK